MTAPCNARKPLVRDEGDRRQLLALLPQTTTRLQGRKRPSRTIWGSSIRWSVGGWASEGDVKIQDLTPSAARARRQCAPRARRVGRATWRTSIRPSVEGRSSARSAISSGSKARAPDMTASNGLRDAVGRHSGLRRVYFSVYGGDVRHRNRCTSAPRAGILC